jgi:MoaA/NifB/PqqE/SkfB family radical SAM enzyme
MLFRNRPYFAHLAFTHRCNLRCRFCHIPEERVAEQDTDGMKRVIDRLDRMGIAVLSISGGGEPLLRPDFATLLNYAADKGLYTKITSNGTMPLTKYEELLASRVSEISISLDGVRGNDLPFSHVGPKILATIRYLNDHLPRGKQLTINITVSPSNHDQVNEMVAYCTREFPHACLWLNPVVVGTGKLRAPAQLKVNPDFLRQVDSPSLLTPGFYKQACEEYYQNETYDWGCLAGEFFFDIKPNGDFWICQDHPAQPSLNVLDNDFERKYREADFSHRRACSGCTYSCYYLTQKSFEPRAWPGMAGVWWKSNTRSDDACRKTADERGWVAGLLHYSAAHFLLAAQSAARTVL